MYILTGPGCGALLTDNLVNYTTKVKSSYNDSFDESHIFLNSTGAWCALWDNGLVYPEFTFGKEYLPFKSKLINSNYLHLKFLFFSWLRTSFSYSKIRDKSMFIRMMKDLKYPLCSQMLIPTMTRVENFKHGCLACQLSQIFFLNFYGPRSQLRQTFNNVDA